MTELQGTGEVSTFGLSLAQLWEITTTLGIDPRRTVLVGGKLVCIDDPPFEEAA